MRQAEEKFAESLHLAQLGMFNLLENDVSGVFSVSFFMTLSLPNCKHVLTFIFAGRTNFSTNNFCRSLTRIPSTVYRNYEICCRKFARKVSEFSIACKFTFPTSDNGSRVLRHKLTRLFYNVKFTVHKIWHCLWKLNFCKSGCFNNRSCLAILTSKWESAKYFFKTCGIRKIEKNTVQI